MAVVGGLADYGWGILCGVDMIRLSVILVAHNSAGYARAALESVRALCARLDARPGAGAWEVWVVDNASTDETVDIIACEFPEVKVLRNLTNEGFGRANNWALAVCRGAVVLLLNFDASYVTGDFTEIEAFFAAQTDCGVIGPKVVYPDGEIQPSNNAYPDLLTEVLRLLGVARLVRGAGLRQALARLPLGRTVNAYLRVYREVDQPRVVDWAAASALFIRRAVLDAGVRFDPAFQMYFEDTDLCRQVRAAGYAVWYHPALTFSHVADRAVARMQADRFENVNWQVGRMVYYRKHHSWWQRVVLRAMVLKMAALKWLTTFDAARRSRLAAVWRAGWHEAL